MHHTNNGFCNTCYIAGYTHFKYMYENNVSAGEGLDTVTTDKQDTQ